MCRKVFGSNLQYNLSVEGPWKQFQDRDVRDVNEAAKIVYDVDTQLISRESAFMVFEHCLRGLNDMPATLEECGRLLQDKSKDKKKIDKWKSVAAKTRAMQKQYCEDKVKKIRDAYLSEDTSFNALYASGAEPESEEAKATKATKLSLIGRLKKDLEEAERQSLMMETREEGEYDLSEERAAREISGEQIREEKEHDGSSKIDLQTWNIVLKKILKTLLVAEDDNETEGKWSEVCKNRLENCVVNDKQLLQFAEELEREAKMYFWGACLFATTNERREKKANKIGFVTWMTFYRNCPNRDAWTEFGYNTKSNSKGVITKIIARLRNERRALGANTQDLPAVTVCPVKKAKATKTTRLTTTKGNFAKTTEVQEPISDDEAEKPQKKKKSAKEDDMSDGDPTVAAVITRKFGEEKFEMQKVMGDIAQGMRQLQQEVKEMKETAGQGSTRGGYRDRGGGYNRGGYNRGGYNRGG